VCYNRIDCYLPWVGGYILKHKKHRAIFRTVHIFGCLCEIIANTYNIQPAFNQIDRYISAPINVSVKYKIYFSNILHTFPNVFRIYDILNCTWCLFGGSHNCLSKLGFKFCKFEQHNGTRRASGLRYRIISIKILISFIRDRVLIYSKKSVKITAWNCANIFVRCCTNTS
jgi:hypothetical protein